MIEEYAVVVDVKNEVALLEIERKTACGLCGKTRGCGISLLGKILKHRSNVFKADNLIQAKVGQSVIVGIQPQALLMSASLVYGVPLLGVFLGAILANLFVLTPNQADAYTMLGALAGLALALLWLKGHSTGNGINARYHPVILRINDQKIINISCERSV